MFDCGATFKGTSLNNQLLQGPNLTSTSLGVFHHRFRFLPESLAIIGDIQAIFHQVKVAEEDRAFLRFLWWPEAVADIRMTVHAEGRAEAPAARVGLLDR